MATQLFCGALQTSGWGYRAAAAFPGQTIAVLDYLSSITYPLIQSDLQTPHIPPFHDNYPTRSPLLGKHWLNFIVGPRYRYCKRTIRYTASAFIGCLPFDLFQRLESSYRNANVVDLHSCVLCNKTLKSFTPSSSNPQTLTELVHPTIPSQSGTSSILYGAHSEFDTNRSAGSIVLPGATSNSSGNCKGAQ